jgi:hypothetical protein
VPQKEISVDVDTDQGRLLAAPPGGYQRRAPRQYADNMNVAPAVLEYRLDPDILCSLLKTRIRKHFVA